MTNAKLKFWYLKFDIYSDFDICHLPLTCDNATSRDFAFACDLVTL